MKKALRLEDTCPFYSRGSATCLASISMMNVSVLTALAKCASEDHDDCPLFLSKVLRSI